LMVLVSSPWSVDTSGPEPFYKGPLIFPLMALSLMVLSAVPSAWKWIRSPGGVVWELEGEGSPLKVGVVYVSLFAFLFGVLWVGLEVATFAFLLGSLSFLGYRSPWKLLILSLAVTISVSLIFKYLLGVFFPRPSIMRLLMG